MTYGVSRAATSPELTLYRKEKKRSLWRAAFLKPRVIYRARINQTFSTTDGVLVLTYDGGSGTLSDVLPDMEMYVGSSLDAHDLGIVRLRSYDATHFYIEETSDVRFVDDLYLTVVESYALRARHVLISGDVPYMDGGVAYSDQHSNPDPTPIMGSNRVLKLTGASVSTQFDWSSSNVIGGLSSISSYATSAPTAASITGATTATPTVIFNTTGFHPIYFTPTTAGGKSFFGVRWVYVWSDNDMPASVQISDPRQDVDSGGWSFEIIATDGMDLDTVPDHTLVILFSEDDFDGTQSDIGPVAGSENVEITGWLAREVNNTNPEKPTTTFTVYTAHYWFGQIPAFPDGVEFTTATPTVWTEFQNLTVDKGLWHMLHWRTTATRVMDVFLTGDSKYTAEVSSLASNLWGQIQEMSFAQIYARAGCNAWNQLFIEVHPQLVPAGSRTWPTVMTITKPDWQGEISFERVTKPEVAVVSLSGVAVDASGAGAAYFSLSPGHAYPHYGTIDVQDHLLVAGQSQANQLAGLYRGWRNNPYPEIPISLAADLRLIDCFPRSKCAIAISSGDTPRGIAYSGNLLPTAVSIVTDPETGYAHRDVTFEAETFEDLNINGDIPGSRADPSIPPTPPLPKLPAFPIILPGIVQGTPGGSKSVLLHDPVAGMVYSKDFNTGPTWQVMNTGLTTWQYQNVQRIGLCANGAIYIASFNTGGAAGLDFVARAPSLGAPWVVQTMPIPVDFIWAMAVDPINTEKCLLWIDQGGGVRNLVLGANGSFSVTGTLSGLGTGGLSANNLSFGQNSWFLTAYNGFLVLNAGATAGVRSGAPGISPTHLRASTTGTIWSHAGIGAGLDYTSDYGVTWTTVATVGLISMDDATAFRLTMDCDPSGQYLMGRWAISGSPDVGKGISTDFGTSWSALPNLPVGNWHFQFAGSDANGVAKSWIAISGTQFKWSEDMGNSWVDKFGNMASIRATPVPNVIRVVEY